MKAIALFLALGLSSAAAPLPGSRGARPVRPAGPLLTTAERTNFQRTGRYAEVERLCQAFARRWPSEVKVETFGRTPQGRPMLALSVCRAPQGSPVMLFQGGIHAGEIDGKDAGFIALREMLEQNDPALRQCNLVFVPVFNVDGHERFGPNNRPNQVGPQEMGWRVTSQNLNLNRDYAKADTPEMRAMLALLRRWDPILYVDLHVTDGAQFQADVANLVEPVFVGSSELQPLGRQLQGELNAQLRASGRIALDFYPSLRDPNDPASGFSNGAYTPRFSTGYWALHNRLAILVETHSWKPYASRVETTRRIVHQLTKLTARHGQEWRAAAQRADSELLAGRSVPLSFRTTDKFRTIEFPGYAYRREPSSVSGGSRLHYFPEQPQVWRVPFYFEVVPDVEVTAPRGGYIVPGWLKAKLQQHGIVCRPVPPGVRSVQVFRADRTQLSSRSFEGHQTLQLSGDWKAEKQDLAPTDLFVPIAQPNAYLAMALLEPRAPDSLAFWGFFNAHFERKEYMEDYVTEEVAERMLASTPAIKAEFDRRLETDPEFAKNPEARLEFFYRRHPSWDQRFNLYPVYRTNEIF